MPAGKKKDRLLTLAAAAELANDGAGVTKRTIQQAIARRKIKAEAVYGPDGTVSAWAVRESAAKAFRTGRT